jgi:hypothetical protein
MKGGWLCEEMGLGKTIEILALVNRLPSTVYDDAKQVSVDSELPQAAPTLASEKKTRGRDKSAKVSSERKATSQSSKKSRERKKGRRVNKNASDDTETEAEQNSKGKVDSDDDFSVLSPPPAASQKESPPSVSSRKRGAAPGPAFELKYDENNRVISRATLIVCPTSLVGQWINELRQRSAKPLKGGYIFMSYWIGNYFLLEVNNSNI